MKIFIVDDDPDFADGIALTLEMAGHQVAFARSGEEALRKVRTHDFDVILMDIRMPGMSGVSSLTEIHKIKPDAKVIMMTAYSVETLIRKCSEEGAVGVLHKPVNSDELLAALAKIKPAGVVLVADEDPDLARDVKAILSDAGYRVGVALSGHDVVDKVRDGRFDVLILDVRLPVMNGLAAYRELEAKGQELPTIVVTGFQTEEAEAIKQLGALSVHTCLVKPIEVEQLLKAVKDVV